MATSSRLFSAPVFLGTAFLLFAIAIVQKLLSVLGWTINPEMVYPRQLLDWALVLLTFEIALTLRQLVELRLDDRRERDATEPPLQPGSSHTH